MQNISKGHRHVLFGLFLLIALCFLSRLFSFSEYSMIYSNCFSEILKFVMLIQIYIQQRFLCYVVQWALLDGITFNVINMIIQSL